MAVLEKIRTKGGWLILIIISIALLAFIVDPASLQSVSSMFSSANDVGEMNGKSIHYNDYAKKVEYYSQVDQVLYQTNSQSDELNERAKQNAWFSFMYENIFAPEFSKIGIGVSDAEMLELAQGENLSPLIANLFTNPNTGEINYATIDGFWRNEQGDPTTQTLIAYFENEIRKEREFSKYGNLVQKTNFINSLQITSGVEARANNVEFKYIAQNYDSQADSTITVSNDEIKKYYQEYKNRFEQTESRDIDYVAFDILPSQEDFDNAKATMEELANKFAQTNDPFQFAVANSDVPPSKKYFAEDDLESNFAEFAFTANKEDVMPVFLDNHSYKTARISDIKHLPDSVKARHILIRYEQTQESYNASRAKADSLYNILKTDPKLFPAIALTHGSDGSAQNGGDLGRFAQDDMVQPFSDSCFLNPANKVMLVETQFGFHIVQVTERGKEVKKVQLATIEREVMPGKQTLNTIYSMANNVVSASDKSYDKFIKYAQENGIEIQKANRLSRTDKSFGASSESRELMRWIYDAKLYNISGVMETNNRNKLVIAAVTKIREAGFASIEDEQPFIRETLLREKQHQAQANKVKSIVGEASELSDVAGKLNITIHHAVDGVNFGSNYISGIGTEPKLTAAVSASTEGKLYGPIAGEYGIYYYTVTGKSLDEGYTEELEKNRISNTTTKNFFNSLLKSAKLKDVRAKFF